MTGDLLTDSDLVELLGVEQPAAQIRVLREHGIQPFVRRDGKPRVTWTAVTATMTHKRPAEPDWSALRAKG